MWVDALFNTAARASEKKADGKFPSVFKGVSCWFLRGNSVSSSSYGMKDSYHFSEFTLEVMNIDGRCLPSLLVPLRDLYLLKRYFHSGILIYHTLEYLITVQHLINVHNGKLDFTWHAKEVNLLLLK